RALFDEAPLEALRVDDTTHSLSESLRPYRCTSLLSTHEAPGTVRTRAECVFVAKPLHDVARRSHRSRYERLRTEGNSDSALSVDEQVSTEPLLAGDEVVVDVEHVLGLKRDPKRIGDDLERLREQRLAIGPCEG